MEPMTAQEVFDKVVNHLRQQNSKSVKTNQSGETITIAGADVCLYRSKDGKKCAAGAIIPDEDYKPEMEGFNISALLGVHKSLSNLVPHEDLIYSLQRIHDGWEVRSWEKEFERLAKIKGLVLHPKESNG